MWTITPSPVQAGDTIIADIDAQAIGSALDSVLVLYDTNGFTELTHNDDFDGLDSQIAYTLPAAGTYYLMVQEYNHPSEGGPAVYVPDLACGAGSYTSTCLWS